MSDFFAAINPHLVELKNDWVRAAPHFDTMDIFGAGDVQRFGIDSYIIIQMFTDVTTIVSFFKPETFAIEERDYLQSYAKWFSAFLLDNNITINVDVNGNNVAAELVQATTICYQGYLSQDPPMDAINTACNLSVLDQHPSYFNDYVNALLKTGMTIALRTNNMNSFREFEDWLSRETVSFAELLSDAGIREDR